MNCSSICIHVGCATRLTAKQLVQHEWACIHKQVECGVWKFRCKQWQYSTRHDEFRCAQIGATSTSVAEYFTQRGAQSIVEECPNEKYKKQILRQFLAPHLEVCEANKYRSRHCLITIEAKEWKDPLRHYRCPHQNLDPIVGLTCGIVEQEKIAS